MEYNININLVEKRLFNMKVPIKWYFQRKSVMPILEAKSDFEIKESEPIVIKTAIEIIDKASEFQGRPYPNMPCFPTSNTFSFSVSFSLVFPSETNLFNFLEFLMHNK